MSLRGSNTYTIGNASRYNEHVLIRDNETDIVTPVSIAQDGHGAMLWGDFDRSRSVNKRDGVTGYQYKGKGGIKLLKNHGNPNSFTWDDARNWGRDLFGYMGNDETFLTSTWLGLDISDDSTGDVQMIMRTETINGFGSNWEAGWNWCFGCDATECDRFDRRYAGCIA